MATINTTAKKRHYLRYNGSQSKWELIHFYTEWGAIVDAPTLSISNNTVTIGSNSVSVPKTGFTTDGTNRNYAVQTSDGKMYVNVPWTDNNTTYNAATGSTLGLIKAAAVRESTITTTQGGTTANRYYGVELDSNGKAFVNVPWTSANVDSVKRKKEWASLVTLNNENWYRLCQLYPRINSAYLLHIEEYGTFLISADNKFGKNEVYCSVTALSTSNEEYPYKLRVTGYKEGASNGMLVYVDLYVNVVSNSQGTDDITCSLLDLTYGEYSMDSVYSGYNIYYQVVTEAQIPATGILDSDTIEVASDGSIVTNQKIRAYQFIENGTALSSKYAGISHSHNYAGSSTAGGAATSANKLNTDAGSATQPIYFSNGVPASCSYSLGASIPSVPSGDPSSGNYFILTSVGAGAAPVWVQGSNEYSLVGHTHSYIPTTEKGANSGVAELDANGKVPSSQLPSYVDDVVQGYYSAAEFYQSYNEGSGNYSTLITGETGKIYIDLHTNKTYRWSGSAFVEISASLALGETSSTAYRGDRGATAYSHASQSGNVGANSSGLYKITTDKYGHVTAATTVQKSDITGLGIPGSDTTYSTVTASAAGLVPATPAGDATEGSTFVLSAAGAGAGSSWVDGSTTFALSGHNHDSTYIKNAGATPKLNDGTTITQPAGDNAFSLKTNGTASDTGILWISEDSAYICNSGDSGYVFGVFDKDVTQNFSSENNAAFAVLQSSAGAKMKGTLTIGGSGSNSQTAALSVNYAPINITNYGNTTTIGSLNSGFCHFQNSASIPFYFNRTVAIDGSMSIYDTNYGMTSGGVTTGSSFNVSPSGTTKATMQYNTTEDCIEFVFA